MLKIFVIAGVVGLFAFAISVAGLSAWRSWQQQHQQREKQKSAPEETAQQGGNAASLIGAKENAEDAIARYNLWLMIFTGVLAFVALIQIGFLIHADEIAGNAASSSAKATKIARDALIASNRPWITLDLAIAGQLAYDDEGWQAGIRWHMPIKYVTKNIGKSPATDVSFFAEIIPFTLPHWAPEKIVDGKPQGLPIPGTNIAKEIETICGFPETMAVHHMGWGQVMFPKEGDTPQAFGLNGNPTPFTEAKTNSGYTGQFLIIACVAYGSTLSEERYRTAKAFNLFKASGNMRFDLNGETVAQSELRLVPSPGGSFAK